MNASNVVDFFNFLSKLLKFSGYQFFNSFFQKNGEVLHSLKRIEYFIFVTSVGYSIYFAVFDAFEVNIDPSLLNSPVLQNVVNNNTQFGMYFVIVLKILPFCIHGEFIRMVKMSQTCCNFVSIIREIVF